MLHSGDPTRIVVEAYPGVLARHLVGRDGYKNDSARKQTEKQHQVRRSLLECILGGEIETSYGLRVEASKSLADDPSGDQLDALLCAIQAGLGFYDARSRSRGSRWRRYARRLDS